MSAEEVINAAVKPDAPAMPAPRPGLVELIRGLVDKDTGVWHTSAQCRELNGSDEEWLAQLGARDGITFVEYMTGFLQRGVVSIGDINISRLSAADQVSVLNNLVFPDRDLLFLEITKATYGVEKNIRIDSCPKCGDQSQAFTIELETDFTVRNPDADLRSPVEVLAKDGSQMLFRVPNAHDTVTASKKGTSDAEINTYIIALCVETKDDVKLEERLEFAKGLSIADRRAVDAALRAVVADVGPQLGEVETRCTKCDSTIPIALDWVSLLLG